MSNNCGKTNFVPGATFKHENTYAVKNTKAPIAAFSINVPYICGEECKEKSCVWWDIGPCKKKYLGICYSWETTCTKDACLLYGAKWCNESVPLLPECYLEIGNNAILYINYTSTTNSSSLASSVNNLGEIKFGFKDGSLRLVIESNKVLQLDLTKYIAVITTSGVIKFYFEEYKYTYEWEGLKQNYTIIVGIKFCPYLFSVSVLLKLSVKTTYYGVDYAFQNEVPIPIPL